MRWFYEGGIDYREFYIKPLSIADAELWRLAHFWRQTRVTFRETSFFFALQWCLHFFSHRGLHLICTHTSSAYVPKWPFTSFACCTELQTWLWPARQSMCVSVCVCKYACVSRSRTTARSHWKERVMVRPEVSVDDVWPGSCWSCSMLLFLCDPSDPALALMSNTHTHFRTPAHSQTHDPAYTHTHARMCRHICKFDYLLKRPVDTYTHNNAQ